MALSLEHIEDARKVRLIEWLCTVPSQRDPDSQNKLADELGVSARTIRNWKADATVRAAWEQFSKHVIGDPEKVQEVLEEMRQLAVTRYVTKGQDVVLNTQQVSAAKVYLAAVDAIRPPTADMAAKRAAEMSDKELEAMIAEYATKEMADRNSRGS